MLQLLLKDFSGVEAEAIGSTAAIRERVHRATKPEEAIVQMNINIYGPRRFAEQVGEVLSDRKFCLQRPDSRRAEAPYENPHFVTFPGLDLDTVVQETTKEATVSKKKAHDERLRELVDEVHNSLSRPNALETVEADQRIKTPLLEHQKSALAYMLQRESGDIPEPYRLWQKGVYGGQEMFIHRITRNRSSTQPDESGGGILADEMGMGKTLCSLALLVQTLEDARGWAEKKNSDEHKTGLVQRYSRSTLVVLPSALLINNWTKEINMHIGETANVIRYHGRTRVRRLDTLADSDIVLTTYHTLATELGKKKSALHRVGWYRIILDEAHIIRRPATKLYRACAELEARSRWCLTGTPIQNRLEDIGALFSFLQVKPFQKISQFRRYISIPFEYGQTVARDRLILLYESLCLRRTKDILGLPGQQEETHFLELTEQERDQYNRTVNILNRCMRTQVGRDAHGPSQIQLHHSYQTWEKTNNMKFGLFQAHMQLRILCNHGTYQKLFSWMKRDLKDEHEAYIGEVGFGSDAMCDGCKGPSPVLGLMGRYRFVEQCPHTICQECLEQSVPDHRSDTPVHCPLCARLRREFEPTASRPGNEEDIEMGDAEEPAMITDGKQHISEAYFKGEGFSSKMKALIDDIKKGMVDSKGIVFSCWTRTLDLVARHLKSERIKYLRIDGEILQSRRQPVIDSFATDDRYRVLLMTTGTGAFGLNLTVANRIFIVEPQWNPSTEQQAIARAIRLGQEDRVEVIRYVIKDTVEVVR
ncbi:hypothetical protein GQ53DRAFT_891050 [Thozetella sp. PMI_491]|nr:hypothetical protein GQ53DRAFT_891050 [Thozetella sp. PMI_491]